MTDEETMKRIHPLINPDSTHYQMFDGDEAIEKLEKLMTIDELMGYAKGNVLKYRMRIGNKDRAEKDAVKIRDYEDYYAYLAKKLVNKEGEI